MKKLAIVFLCMIISGVGMAQPSITGNWEGHITINGQELGIIFQIEGEDGNYSGTLDIPAQGAYDLPFIYVVAREDSVTTAFNTGSGMGEFKGQFISQNRIEGSYLQSGSEFPFQVQRQNPSGVDVVNPGAGDELIIHNGDVNIAGTLVLPEETERPQLVILLSGSGAQNRDSEIAGFKPFADIAEYLKLQNIASFRFDDRQVGQSTGTFSTASLSTLSSDVDSIIRFLQDSVGTKFSEITLLGHSQGGIVAGKVAQTNPEVDKLILMASPTVSMARILRFQVQNSYEQIELPETTIEQEINARENLMKSIVDGENIEEASAAYKEAYREVLNSLNEEQLAAISEDKETFIERQTNQLISLYSTPQMQSLLFYDPTEDLSELSIPVFVLLGGKDSQVPVGLNEAPVRNALREAGAAFQITVVENSNHLFQKAETGEVSEYASLDKQFIEGFLPLLSEWIESN